MVFVNVGARTFRTEKLARAKYHRKTPCLLNIDDERIFLIGGQNTKPGEDKWYRTVSQYSIGKNKWIEGLPKLNIPRVASSACYCNGHIFVVGGVPSTGTVLNSIEKLNLEDLGKGKATWKLIEPICGFPGRAIPVCAAINSEEIAILGGSAGPTEMIGDLWIFNVNTEKFTEDILKF